MLIIDNYDIKEKIYSGEYSEIYKALKKNDGCPVIVKKYLVNKDLPRSFSYEYEFLKKLDIEGINKPIEFIRDKDFSFLVSVDIGGKSLDNYIDKSVLNFSEKIRIAIKICDILLELHNKQIIHKNINPSNIIYNRETGQIELIDFEIASFDRPGSTNIKPAKLYKENLNYISPELTGRINRQVDYRSDLYSLGITLYELFAERLPFISDNPLEILHAHIAGEALRLDNPVIGKDIPAALADIAEKLMEKMPEDRYQSLVSLHKGLNYISDSLENKSDTTTPLLPDDDVSGHFNISEKIYGRERETQQLIKAFDNVCRGNRQLIIIKGESGSGKTTLVKEIYRPVPDSKGTFISGKFEESKQHVPFSAFTTAINDLIEQVINEGDNTVRHFKEKILDALGTNAAIIRELVPDIEKITGELKPLPEYSVQETKNRFFVAVRTFVKIFAEKGHPLVIFLDDFQWAGETSIELLESICNAGDANYLLIIIATRDKSEGSLCNKLLKKISNNNGSLEIDTVPLNRKNTYRLIRDSFKNKDGHNALSNFIFDATKGNPLFIKELLHYFKNCGLIRLKENKPGINSWHYNFEEISKADIPDNIIELFVNKIKALPTKSRELIKLASLFGYFFNLKELSVINETQPSETSFILWDLLKNNLIYPMNDYLEMIDLESFDNINYMFAHNLVWEAADALITDEERKALSYKSVKLLIKVFPEKYTGTNIYLSAGLLNTFNPDNESDRLLSANLNLKSGLKSGMLTDYSSAFYYLSRGIDSCNVEEAGKEFREQNYDLIMKLHIDAAEAASITQNYKAMDEIIEIIFAYSKSIFDKIKAYQIIIISYLLREDNRNALEYSILILKQLGTDIKIVEDDENNVAIYEEIEKYCEILTEGSIKSMPEISDSYKLATMKILSLATSPAYHYSFPAYLLIIKEMLAITSRFGKSPQMGIMLSHSGRILASFNKFNFAAKCGNLALSFVSNERMAEKKIMSRVISGSYIMPFSYSQKDILAALESCILDGVETGNYYCATVAAVDNLAFSCLSGVKVRKTMNMMLKTNELLEHLLSASYKEIIESIRKFCNSQESGDTGHFNTFESIFAKSAGPNRNKDEKRLDIVYYLLSAIIYYLNNNIRQASQNIEKAIDNLGRHVPSYYRSRIYFYHSIINYKNPNTTDKTGSNLIEYLKLLYDAAPENFSHLYKSMKALQLEKGNKWEALAEFDAAIEAAASSGNILEEAIITELAADFLFKNNLKHQAEAYINDAYNVYRQIGAAHKANSLQQQYPGAISTEADTDDNTEERNTGYLTEAIDSGLDLMPIIKSYNIVTEEQEIPDLLKKLLYSILQIAGATKASFYYEDENDNAIFAEYNSATNIFNFIGPEQINKIIVNLPSVIKYILSSGKTLVINNPEDMEKYYDGMFIPDKEVKAFIAMPVKYRENLKCIINLENRFLTNVFQEERTEIIKIFAAQIGVSIEHANAYKENEKYRKHLEHQVEARAKELVVLNKELESEIEERIKTEKALRESQNQYQLMFESFGLAICLVDLHLNILFTNKLFIQWCENLGLKTDFKNKKLYDILPYNKNKIIDDFNFVFSSGEVFADTDNFQIGPRTINTTVRKIPVFENDRVTKVITSIKDITEERETAKSLVRSEKLYGTLINTMIEGLAILDAKGNFTFANKKFYEMVGKGEDYIIGKNINELKQEEGQEEITKQFEKRKKGADEPYEFTVFKENGDPSTLSVHPKPLFDEEGKFSGSVATFIDISQRKKIEDELKNSEEKFRFVFDNTIDILYQLNLLSGHFEYISPSIENILGFTTEEAKKFGILGLTERVHPDDIHTWSFLIDTEIKISGTLFTHEYRIKDKSGIYKYLSDHQKIICDEEGMAISVIGVIRDISEQKAMEQATRAGEEALKALVNAMSDIIIMIDRRGVIWEANETAANNFNLKKSAFIGINLFSLFPEDITEKRVNLITSVFESGKALNTEDFYDDKWYDLGIFPIMDDNSQVDKVVIIVRDITDRKIAEKSLVDSEKKLKKLNATKDKFFSIISHDLKNPLGAFLNMSNTLASDFDEFSNNDIKEFINNVYKSSKNLVDLLENLLFWSRSQSGTLEFNPMALQVNILIDDIVSHFRMQALKKKINLSSEAPKNSMAFADPNVITFILRNLISNSIKFTAPGGEVVVAYKEYTDYIEIEVSDNGIGIAKEDVNKLFKIDEKFKRPGTNDEEGTGLGLILCKEFIEMSKGTIWVQSQVGQGSVFVFTLPKQELH